MKDCQVLGQMPNIAAPGSGGWDGPTSFASPFLVLVLQLNLQLRRPRLLTEWRCATGHLVFQRMGRSPSYIVIEVLKMSLKGPSRLTS